MAAPMKRSCEDLKSDVSSSGDGIPVKKQDTDCHNFLSWCEEEGIIHNKKVTVSRTGSCAQCGMIALEDISQGETLFTIPRSALLHPGTCSPALAEQLEKDVDSLDTASGWVPLILAVMYEYTNPNSRWRPYLDLFPDYSELDQPMFWDSALMQQELRGTGVPEAVQRDLINIHQEYNNVVLPFIRKYPQFFREAKHTVDLYKRIVSFVMAYSFTEPKDDDELDDDDDDDEVVDLTHPPMMVPLADALNHIAKNNARLNFGKESLTMVAIKDIKKGEEVFNTYGEIANWQLLHMYGFAEQYPENIYDTVDIPHKYLLEVAGKHEAYSATLADRWAFLKDGEMVSDDGMFVIGMDGVLTEDELHTALKIITIDADGYDALGKDDGWDSDVEESFKNDELCNLPESWQSLLTEIANRVLQEMNNLHPKDLTIESSTPEEFCKMNSRARYAFFVRMGQRKILERLIDFCRITW